MSKLEKIKEGVIKDLPLVFTEALATKIFQSVTKEYSVVSAAIENKVLAKTKIKVHWEDKSHENLFTLKANEDLVTPNLMLCGWTMNSRQYVSLYTAMYFHGLVDQRPKDFHLTKEIKNSKSQFTSLINDRLLKQTFMKEPKKTNQLGYFKGSTFYFHTKVDTALAGIENLNKEAFSFQISNIERTFIDVCFAPGYGGGLPTILKAFENANLKIEKIIEYYRLMNPIYPMWQRIGLFLELMKKSESNSILKYFGKPESVFFADHGYRDTWEFNDKWRVFYPKGVEL
ncbi:MAG: hypothetical protein WA160_02325 [Pseudobdellovibrio sp.]